MSLWILPENVTSKDGAGAEIALGEVRGKPLLLKLGITRIMEQESLEVVIWGSSDRSSWKKLQAFPRKCYCGTYSLLLDLERFPEVRHLRAEWKMNRWRPVDRSPLFGFYLVAEEPKFQAVGV